MTNPKMFVQRIIRTLRLIPEIGIHLMNKQHTSCLKRCHGHRQNEIAEKTAVCLMQLWEGVRMSTALITQRGVNWNDTKLRTHCEALMPAYAIWIEIWVINLINTPAPLQTHWQWSFFMPLSSYIHLKETWNTNWIPRAHSFVGATSFSSLLLIDFSNVWTIWTCRPAQRLRWPKLTFLSKRK